MTRASLAIGLLCTLIVPMRASAFCGFYVSGADSSLYANATMTVLMRDGTRTVLSMQNNYQGPPDAFALVIPVPSVLQKEQVKILPKEIFQKVDSLAAPRLVEYWETDPCSPPPPPLLAPTATSPGGAAPTDAGSAVRVEAQFVVGEYEVVILSADDSSALDTWLRGNEYNIPQGAEAVLRPYVAAGMKFFVAKVDPTKVAFENGQAALSPLRFYYDTPEFSLPVRLGLLNSQGSQDLIVHILARQRYEVANYPNATIPTNIRVQDAVRNDFASFYEALFSRVLEKQPGAVVTEYSWSAGSCDPCPTPPLGEQEILTLGGDVLEKANQNPGFGFGLTLTRLHARYTKESLGEDLVFKQADAILGGRGMPDNQGNLDQKVERQPGGVDNFQGRYVILHPWEKAISCDNPIRGFWGGPSGMRGTSPSTMAPANSAIKGAPPKAGDLPALVAESIAALGVDAKRPLAPLGNPSVTKDRPASGGMGGTGENVAGSPVVAGAPAAPGDAPRAPQPATRTSSSCAASDPGSTRDAGAAVMLLALAVLAGRRRRGWR